MTQAWIETQMLHRIGRLPLLGLMPISHRSPSHRNYLR